jgi:iron complex outermembrane recepter protein
MGGPQRRRGVATNAMHGSAIALLVSLGGVPALAQAQPAASTEAAPVPEETAQGLTIMVTAQRRQERLIDVPISVAVTTGTQLEARSLTSITDLRYTSPGLTFGDRSKLGNQGFALRGIGTIAFSDGTEQSVGTVIDGVVIGRPNGSVGDLVDVDRVEVLRGPQGTLFGKNSSAGLINVVTRRPVFENEGLLRASYGSREGVRLEGVANFAPSDSLAVRLVGYRFARDGFVTNIYQGQNKLINDRDDYGFRGRVLWQPSDRTEFLLTADYSSRDSNCCQYVTRTRATNGLNERAGDPITGGADNLRVNANTPSFTRFDAASVTLESSFTLGSYTLTSITAYRDFAGSDGTDRDQGPTNSVSKATSDTDWNQFSQEIRLASPTDRQLSYVVGLFLFDQTVDAFQQEQGDLGFPPLFFARDVAYTVDTTSVAAFGEATFKVTDDLRLIAGLRYTDESYSMDFARTTPAGARPVPGTPVLTFSVEPSFSNWSWRLGAQYDLGDAAMAYVTASRGYKGPSLNAGTELVRPEVAVARPEIATSYEAGIKAVLMERRLQISGAIFRTEIEDFQAQVRDGTVVPATVGIRNAGSLVSQGLELEVFYRPVSWFSLTGSLASIDAAFENFPNVPCYSGQTVAEGCVGGAFNASGIRPPNAPRWTSAAIARFEPAPVGGLAPFFQIAASYKGEVNFSTNNDPRTVQEGVTLVDLAAGASTEDDRYELSVHVRNLFDQNFVNGIQSQSLDGPTGYLQYVSPDAQRTYGITLTRRF